MLAQDTSEKQQWTTKSTTVVYHFTTSLAAWCLVSVGVLLIHGTKWHRKPGTRTTKPAHSRLGTRLSRNPSQVPFPHGGVSRRAAALVHASDEGKRDRYQDLSLISIRRASRPSAAVCVCETDADSSGGRETGGGKRHSLGGDTCFFGACSDVR